MPLGQKGRGKINQLHQNKKNPRKSLSSESGHSTYVPSKGSTLAACSHIPNLRLQIDVACLFAEENEIR